jgi:predicted MFS family arabinose efflux permease
MNAASKARLIFACCTAIVCISFGIRQGFGLFLGPITQDLGWSRETLATTFATQVLMIGLLAPVAGALAALAALTVPLAVIAVSNAAGSWLSGWLGGRLRKKYLLSGIYLACAVLGFMWLSTVPLTSGLVAQLFGPRHMATLYAIVYLSHQLGSFVGVWAGGRVFDATGSYDVVWWMTIGLGVLAALFHLPIDDRPVARLSAALSARTR